MVISLVLIALIYYFNNLTLIILLIIYLLYLLKQNLRLFIFTLIILGFFITGLISLELRTKNRLLGEKTAKMVVIKRESEQLFVKHRGLKYQLKTKDNYEVGDIIIVSGTFNELSGNHVPELFNYAKYGKYIGLVGSIKVDSIEKIGKKISIEHVQDRCIKYYDKYYSSEVSAYLKALVLGDKSSLDKTIINNINSLGISHLFVVSGLHVTLILGMIKILIQKIVKNTKIEIFITLIILVIYVLMTNLLISVIRVVLGYIFGNLNKKYNLKLTTLDIISIETIIPLLLYPYYIFQSSFILSFSLTYALVIGRNILKSKNYFKNLFIMSIYCQIISLPLAYNFSNEFNLLSVIFNLFFVPFVSYIMLPFSIITTILPFLNKIYLLLITCFEKTVTFSDNISIYVNIPKISIIYLLVFILLIYYLFKMIEERKIKKCLIMILIIYLSIWLNISKLDIYDQIIFFDLPNGEATLIHQAFDQINILIDTGDITTKQNNSILQYLRKRGIRTLDYVIITHSDSDHIGGLNDIMEEIKVKNLLTNYYEKKEVFEPYKKYNSQLNIYYLKAGTKFKYCDYLFQIYSPDISLGNVNNNSLVFSLSINDFHILFTGDIEEEVENTLRINNQITYDLLKVAHHGSNTSTHSVFLSKVQFKEAIIMNGYNNIFGFPSKYTLDRLNPHKYYITSYEKTIIFEKPFFKTIFKKQQINYNLLLFKKHNIWYNIPR